MNRLLDKSLKPLAIYALIVLLLSIPAYYFIVDRIWVSELDKHQYVLRDKIESRLVKLNLPDSTVEQTINIWNKIEPGFVFTAHPTDQVIKDSVYTTMRFDDFLQDREQFRALSTSVRINNKHYRLLIETNMEEADETVTAISLAAIFFFLLLLGGFILLIRRTSAKIWQPFYITLDTLRKFKLNSDQEISFTPSDTQEFNELNDSLSKLLIRNVNVYKQQKEFTENVSHELQTPLAIVQSKLDLLFQHPTLTNDQYNIVESAHTALTRVSRINKNLLLLARIENHQFADHENIDLSILLHNMMEMLSEHLEQKQLTLENILQPDVKIEANSVLLEVLINNLLINAIRHNSIKGRISIELTEHRLRLTNTGSHTLAANKLFKRFSTTSTETPGSGLGLAIIKQICDLYQWKVSYSFINNLHIFTISFKDPITLPAPSS
ncbi:sensor histidine kinase [Pedobacter cryoconitis]|uniref:histidine kinase n=1 Tax=Pedobacter cryoconitis TaxID=188932 RepID=A0A327RYU7_9SPHI|nr:HAMP domain-containing sensor histidine kinase [Pedobacter cryoconitis]RAJ20573.1 signal transduction histidine kinase [Pedobacter cryoconitis]